MKTTPASIVQYAAKGVLVLAAFVLAYLHLLTADLAAVIVAGLVSLGASNAATIVAHAAKAGGSVAGVAPASSVPPPPSTAATVAGSCLPLALLSVFLAACVGRDESQVALYAAEQAACVTEAPDYDAGALCLAAVRAAHCGPNGLWSHTDIVCPEAGR